MSNVIAFSPPTAQIPPPALPSPALAAMEPTRPEVTYGLFTIARFLGVDRRGESWKKTYVQALIDQEGFPPPIPLLVGTRLSGQIHARRSQWSALAVAAWFRARVPAQAIARIEDAAALEEATRAADRLDGRAEELF
jgi:hypothetical protein